VKITASNQSRIAGVVLLLLVAFCYRPVYHANFINFDDFLYVSSNDYVKAGFTVNSIRWAFTSFDLSNWHPVTMLSHMLDYSLFGMNAAGHHLMNVLIHAGNTLLLFLVLRTATGALWRSAGVAFLFALHPLHVESVAWISERKDVLSAFFLFLSLYAYAGYVHKRTVFHYLAAFVLFVLALMSKPMAVTFPFLLLLLDYWPFGRYSHPTSDAFRNAGGRLRIPLPIVEKIPFLLMSVVFSVLTYLAQSQTGAVSSLAALPLHVRCANAINAYALYVVNMLFPYNLSVFYPLTANLPLWRTILAACFLVLTTGLAWHWRKRRPFVIVGWLWYLGTLVPVIGLVQVGSQALADRYTYIPLVGLFILLIWMLPSASPRKKTVMAIEGAILLPIALFLIVTTRSQAATWADTMSVFMRADEASDGNVLAKLQVAGQYAQRGKRTEAENRFEELLAFTPTNITALHNFGVFLANNREYDRGIDYLRKALRLQPNSVTVHNSLAKALTERGKDDDADEAERLLRRSLTLKPENPETRYYLAMLLAGSAEHRPEAIIHFREAIRINPGYQRARLGLAITLRLTGQNAEAERQYLRVCEENPVIIAENFFNVGGRLAEQNRLEEAATEIRRGLRILPDNIGGRLFLAGLLEQKGNKVEALKEYKRILNAHPKDISALIGAGTVLASLNRHDEALCFLHEALRIEPENVSAHNNIGIVLLRKGENEEALAHFREATRKEPNNGEVHYNMGLVYEKMNQFVRAEGQMGWAIRCKPDYPAAQAALLRIRKRTP
jgi:tetratricopeptide (TPR) repeat protein